nr:glutaredoxin 1 [Hymenolepis microstoma]
MPSNPSLAYDMVTSAIESKRIVVFTKTYCPYCKMVNSLLRKTLDRKDYDYNLELIDISGSRYEKELMDVLEAITGRRTVPRVFVDGKCIGGYDDTKRLCDSGRLQRMLYN